MDSYSDFFLTEEDLALVALATEQSGKINWLDHRLQNIKDRIKLLHRSIQNESCCYCRKDFTDEFSMVIDIEHVLPKSVFEQYVFSDFNLSVACKRCNMLIKKARLDFLRADNLEEVCSGALDKNMYLIIHPNFDVYKDNLSYVSVQHDDTKIVKYLLGRATEKGQATYEFFHLCRLEIDQFDRLQGIEASDSDDFVANVDALLGL